MPAVSKAQQRFMGMVHAAQKSDMENPSPEVKKAADSISDKDAKDFASTSHKGLPDKIKEVVLSELRSVRAIQTDYMKVIDSMEKHLELYKKSKGTPEEKQHIQHLKTLTAQKKKLAAELDAKVSGMYKDAELKVDEMNTTGNVDGYGTPFAFGKNSDKKRKKTATQFGYTLVNNDINNIDESVNEWKLQLDLGKVNPLEFEKWADSSLQKKHKIKVSGSNKNWTIVGKGNDDRMGSSADWISQLLGKAWTINKIKVVQKESVNESWSVKDGNVLSNGKLIGYYDFDRDSDSFWVDDVKRGKGQLSFDTKKEVEDYFKKNEKDAVKHLQKLRESVNENRWLELKRDESTAQSKIGKGISNINKQLAEMERFLNWYGKIKNESGVDNKSYWKRTNSHIYSIKERLLKLDQKIRQISE